MYHYLHHTVRNSIVSSGRLFVAKVTPHLSGSPLDYWPPDACAVPFFDSTDANKFLLFFPCLRFLFAQLPLPACPR